MLIVWYYVDSPWHLLLTSCNMHILLLVIELLFLTLHEASFMCLFQAPQYNYFNNCNVILMETSVSRKIKYIMYNVQSHDVLDNKVVHRATYTYERWHFTHMWKTLTWSYHLIKRGVFGPLLLAYIPPFRI